MCCRPTCCYSSNLPTCPSLCRSAPPAAMSSTGAQRMRHAAFRTPAQSLLCSHNNVWAQRVRMLPCCCPSAQFSSPLLAYNQDLPVGFMPPDRRPLVQQVPNLLCCPFCATTSHAGELRYQELVDPSNGIPPYLMAKGAAAGRFRAGAPVSAWGPPLPGYARQISGGLYAQPGTPCPDRIK